MNTKAKEITTVVLDTRADQKVRVMRLIGMILIAAILLTTVAFAEADYGQKGGEWVLTQIFWVALVVIAVGFIGLLLKRNFTLMAIEGVVGAIALVVIKDPQKLKTMGDAIWGVFGV